MKLKNLFGNWTTAIKTFPVSHVLLLALSIVWILMLEGSIDSGFGELILALILAFIISCYGPLFLIHSDLKNKNIINWIFQIGSIVLGGIYYYILCRLDIFEQNYSEGLLYLWVLPLAALGVLLIIALLYRNRNSKIRSSWTNLFLSIAFGWLAGTIIRGGISGALASIEALFDVYIDYDIYNYIGTIAEIFLAGSFMFNFYITFTENLNKESDFDIKSSRLRKIFSSYIFLPLALIYLAIFAAYGIKILITGVWPEGVIVRLGIGYFALGIASSYLVYPDKTRVHEIINKILYVSFILVAFMMIGAIVKRINQYGITINRCFVCYIIAFIVIFSVLSLIFTKKRLLSFVSTLAILGLISVYGRPINVSNVSFNSQLNRLETLLAKENISLPLDQGVLKDLDDDTNRLILGAIDELAEKYDKDKVINKIINYEYEDSYRSSRRSIREFLGLNTDYDYYYYPNYRYRNYNKYGEDGVIDVSGYSKILSFDKYLGGQENMVLGLEIDNQEYSFDLFNYVEELKEKADLFEKSYGTEDEENMLQEPALLIEDGNYKLEITGFSLEENKEGELSLYNVRGYILIK